MWFHEHVIFNSHSLHEALWQYFKAPLRNLYLVIFFNKVDGVAMVLTWNIIDPIITISVNVHICKGPWFHKLLEPCVVVNWTQHPI